MKNWYFVIDVAKCENCNNCFLACKDEHCGNDWNGYAASQPLHGQRWMNIQRKERGEFPVIDVAYLPKPCMHCDHAPCIKAAKNGAVFKRDDGLVIIDPEKAVGQKGLVAACPYGAIWWNEDKNLPQKCTGCAHLLDDGWKAPRCVQACPTGALSIHHAEADRLNQIRRDPEFSTLGKADNPTLPRVFYKNLYRYTRCFIAGSAATRKQDIEECIFGLTVQLRKDGKRVQKTVTDAFGDFKFDGLAPHSGIYRIDIGDKESVTKTIEVDLGKKSVSVGTIWI
jgi:Fe-S-cluster-containing dehydrogenase component